MQRYNIPVRFLYRKQIIGECPGDFGGMNSWFMRVVRSWLSGKLPAETGRKWERHENTTICEN